MDEMGMRADLPRTAMPGESDPGIPATAITPSLPVAPTPPIPSAPPAPTHKVVRLVDVEEPTIRRAGDLVNAVVSAIGLALVLVIAVYGRETTEGVTQDVQEVVEGPLRDILLLPVQFIEGAVIFAVPVSVAVTLIIKRHWRTLLRATVAGLVGVMVALIALWAVDLLPLANPLRMGLTLNAQWILIPAFSPFVAALSAYLTAVSKASNGTAVRWSWYALFLVLVLAVLQGDLNIVGATASVLLGRVVGFFTRWVIGVHSTRATGVTLVTGLRRAGLDPERVIRVDSGPGEPHSSLITSSAPVGHNAQSHANKRDSSKAPSNSASKFSPFSLDYSGSSIPDPNPVDDETLLIMGSSRGPSNDGPRTYAVWSDGARTDVTVLDDDRQVVGFLSNLWETIRIRGTDPRVTPGLRENAERAALMSFAVKAAGVTSPTLRGFARISDSVILVEDHIPGGRHLSEVTEIGDSVLDALWLQLREAHDSGIAHRSLTAEHIIVDENDVPWIIGWRDGEIAASEISRRIDLTQMLCLLAVQFGSTRALAAANRGLTESQLASIAPLLQKVTLPASTREQISRDLLNELREALTILIPTADAEPLQLRRFSPKTLFTFAMVMIAAFVVIGSMNFEEVVASFKTANLWWLLGAFVAGLSTYFSGALGLVAFTPHKLRLWRTILAEVAGGMISIVAPAGVGPAAVEVRYLTKQGVAGPLAVATVSLAMVSRFVGTVTMLLFVTLTAGGGGTITLPSTALLIVIALVVGVVGILVAIPAIRNWAWRKIEPTAKQIWQPLVWVLGSPRRLLLGFLGAVLMSIGYIAAFGLTLAAFGYSLPLAVLTVTYLAASAAGSLVPTPAGIGAIELALTSGLTVAGIPASVALSATLIFRVLTLWMRLPTGWLALRYLQRINAF